MVRLLLEKGAAIDGRDENGWTPLIRAAGNGCEPLVKLLLEKGAAIDAKDYMGRTARYWAGVSGNGVVMKLLHWRPGAD